ncbi:MAG: ATP-binding protein [Lachnospiraceae bacterium]|nr:ATP-binding protein [Lachnospiraceae bacterium]
MYCKVLSGAVHGIGGLLIQVETDVSDGLPGFSMVGMLSSEVKEAGERVRTALKNSKYKIPPKRITVNLSPADIRKEGAAFDLAIAVAILVNLGYIPQENLKDVLVIGELSLNGDVNRVNGVLPIISEAAGRGCKICVVPEENAREASVVKGMKVFGVKTLRETMEMLMAADSGKYAYKIGRGEGNYKENTADFSEVIGQVALKRAAEVAAAGMHNFLMVGPPGSGKTMIASRIPSILPSLGFAESIEITKIYSVAGKLDSENPLITNRPFRAPHHTTTRSAMAGGGRKALPGEITLANHGVLFLDELPEFDTSVLEILRQPLEEGRVELARVYGNYSYPAKFMLVAAMNPCKCGYYPDMSRCTCSSEQVKRYLRRISRPLLDRIDICVEVPKLEFVQIASEKKEESSADIRERVERARIIQKKRYGSNVCYNSRLNASETKRYCSLDAECSGLVEKVYESMGLTARSYHKLLKVSRTIADLDGGGPITKKHVSEALLYKGFLQGELRGGGFGR